MSKLILHIGSHKTGTTAIQRACRQYLSKKASYLNIRPTGTRIVQSQGALETFDTQIDLTNADKVFRPRKGKDEKTYVTSDEELFWIKDPKTVEPFARLLKERFDQIVVLCYLRRQDLLAVSHRKQVAEGNTPAALFYGTHPTPLPQFLPHFHSYFDYEAKLSSIWSANFGKENIVVVPYDKAELHEGDVVDDFAMRAGITFTNTDQIISNTSDIASRTLAGLVMGQMNLPPEKHKKILAKLKNQGTFKPTRAKARTFLDHFSDANIRLAENWTWKGAPFRFDQSFDMYPTKQAPVWTHNDMVQVLRTVLSET